MSSVANQAVCNGASVSTDPTYAATSNYQKCNAADPSSAINTNITNVAGNAVVQGSSLGNSFEADSNAPNMPIWTKQINNSGVTSNGQRQCLQCRRHRPALSSSAIGNTGPDHPLLHQLDSESQSAPEFSGANGFPEHGTGAADTASVPFFLPAASSR